MTAIIQQIGREASSLAHAITPKNASKLAKYSIQWGEILSETAYAQHASTAALNEKLTAVEKEHGEISIEVARNNLCISMVKHVFPRNHKSYLKISTKKIFFLRIKNEKKVSSLSFFKKTYVRKTQPNREQKTWQ